jgi:hypothetical protein
MNTQIQFYINNNINAVAYGPQLAKHWHQRANLMEAHLGISLKFLKSASVLEFGPCGGENALFLAINGAEVTLVEPNSAMHHPIKDLFEGTNLRGLHNNTLESFETEQKFDLVIAEGFLLAIPDRKVAFKKIFSFSQGLCIITYSCMYGNFFEGLKRYIFSRCLEEDKNLSDDVPSKKLAIASKLFQEDFTKLGSARTFESWALDILMNPAGNSTILDDFQDLHDYFLDLGMEITGCSPNWDTRNNHRWYKDISDRSILDEWRTNLSFIITGNKDIQLSQSDIKIIAAITPLFFNYSCTPEKDLPLKIKNISRSLSPYFKDVINLLDIATDSNQDELINIYTRSVNCRNWGMPHHYLALAKKRII